MATCPTCRQAATTRDGFDRRGRHCHRDFTHASSGAFSGYGWPPEVIVTAVRWYLSYPLSARQVTELLGEESAKLCGATCGWGRLKRDDRLRVDSQAALFSPAARVTMAAATAGAWSPQVADWSR